MFTLKQYQTQALSALETYLAKARLIGPAEAFARYVADNPTDRRPQRYTPKKGLEDVPYVCLRIPTGGGKTFLAAQSVGIAASNYMDRDFPLVLWMTPTTTIRKQTAEALKNPSHPCHQILETRFGLHRVAVCDIADINNLRPTDLAGKVCIVVATYQSFRVDERNKEKRKVYGHNENFESHFKALPNTAPGLDRDPKTGQVLYSFVNLMHQLGPLVIADEAHKAISDLSEEMLCRINPACILEFTATPVESNILFRAFASQLKAEEMVKLPFALTIHKDWVQAVSRSIEDLKKLQKIAAEDPEYIRPIVLIQAQPRDEEQTAEVIKRHLIDNEGVKESEIAIVTGEQRELDNINLFDKTYPINYIITVEALKEGWDCSFAYILCSVKQNTKSPIDVEQLLGRVMRMPYAKRRRNAALNEAYAHVLSQAFQNAEADMYDHLTNMGFNEEEAAAYIEVQQTLPGVNPYDTPLFRGAPALTLSLVKEPRLDDLPEEVRKGVSLKQQSDGSFLLRTEAAIPQEIEDRLVAANPKMETQIRRSVALHRENVRKHEKRKLTPSEESKPFAIPLMLFDCLGGMEEPTPRMVLFASGWSPRKADARLGADEFRYDESARTFLFDLEGEQMKYHEVSRQEQYSLLAGSSDWDALRLSRWLNEHCREDDAIYADMLDFCRRCVEHLLDRGDFDITTLARAKYALATALKAKLGRLRLEALKSGFQTLLFDVKAKVAVSLDYAHKFPVHSYAENASAYTGHYAFQKHYYPVVRDLKSVGEEHDCAKVLDRHPEVLWWVRNVDRKPGSFSLPISSGHNFYPDFVAKLKDGRTLIVEYKGKAFLNEDTREKENIGQLWEEKSQGQCLFLLATWMDAEGRHTQRQIDEKIRLGK